MTDSQPLPNSPLKYNSLESLQSYLSVIKSLKKDDLDDEYFDLMSSAKQLLGEVHPRMATFYYEYGNYLLEKIEKNGEVFGTFKPTKQQRQERIVEAQQSQEDSREQPQHEDNDDTEPKKKPEQASNVTYKDSDVVIEDDTKPAPQTTEKRTPENRSSFTGEKDDIALPETAEKEQDEDDEEICYESLEVCLSILMTEQSKYLNGELQLGNEEVDKMIQNLAKVKGRLGDFYSIKENFVEALTEYDEAIQYRKKLNRSEPDRVIASLELAMGNAYLFQGLEGAESDALTHLISAVNILTDTLQLKSLIDGYPRPTKDKATVERLMYLPRWDDSEDIKELKQLISELLDKIEDTDIQSKQFADLQKIKLEQKKQAEQQAHSQTGFTDVPKDVKVVSLGTFGNANCLIKRKTPPTPAGPSESLKEAEHQPKRQE